MIDSIQVSIDTIPSISEEHPLIRNIQDTLTVVAHNTTPHIVLSVDITWVDLFIATVACLAGLLAAYFSYRGWRSQKRTQEGVLHQNERYVDFKSQTKHMYRTLVYALAIDAQYQRYLPKNVLYYPQEVYLEKTKPFSKLIPIQPFINNKVAMEALGDLLNQMNLVNIEHDDAIRLINDLKNGSITISQYLDRYKLVFNNISFKPFHIIHEMLVASKKLHESGVNCDFNENVLAQCIIEKHHAFVTRFSDGIMKLSRSDIASIDFNFVHVKRAMNEFDCQNSEYVVRLTPDAAHKGLFEHLRDVLNDDNYNKLFNRGVLVWDILTILYKVEVTCELKNQMEFYDMKMG